MLDVQVQKRVKQSFQIIAEWTHHLAVFEQVQLACAINLSGALLLRQNAYLCAAAFLS